MLAVNAIVAANVQVPSSGAAAIIADFTEHAIRVAYIARRDAVRLPDAEWRVPGIYVLITDDGSHGVYVGKSNDLRSRVMQHKTNNVHVPTWARAMLVKRDTSNGFSSAEVGYLEGRLSAELDAISGITVVKGKTNGDATLPPHMQASLDALLSSILAAVRVSRVSTRSATTKTSTDPLGSHEHRLPAQSRIFLLRGCCMQAPSYIANDQGSPASAPSPRMGKLSSPASDTSPRR